MAKLFGQSEQPTPNLNEKVAWGDENVPTKNTKWSDILAWLQGALFFLKPSNNLSDLTSPTFARYYLDVYSKSTVDDKIANKADVGNVLELDNTTPYTPTSSYHPATMKYADEGKAEATSLLASGTYTWTGGSMGDMVTSQTVSIGKTLSTTSYHVVLTQETGLNAKMPLPLVTNPTTTTFVLQAYTEGGNGGNPRWRWSIFKTV